MKVLAAILLFGYLGLLPLVYPLSRTMWIEEKKLRISMMLIGSIFLVILGLTTWDRLQIFFNFCRQY